MCLVVWKDELRSDFGYHLIDGTSETGLHGAACLEHLGGRYHATAKNEDLEGSRFVELRIDPELNVISGDVFDDAERQKHRFSFISECIAYSETDTTFRVVAPLDMFDHPEILKGALLLKGILGEDGAPDLQVRHLKAFDGSFDAISSFLEEDLCIGPLVRQGGRMRRFELGVLRTSDVEMPRIFGDDAADLGGAASVRSVEQVFQRAGVDISCNLLNETLDVAADLASGEGLSNEELHRILVQNGGIAQSQDWQARLLFTGRLEKEVGRSDGILGRMFDTMKPARQGVAVFLESIAGTESVRALDEPFRDAEIAYLRLFITVHELGHLFNLLHPHQKDFDRKRARYARPDALSWMSYQRLFPFGPVGEYVGRDAWDGKGLFRGMFNNHENFDAEELRFLRHGPYPEVVMGGDWAATAEDEATISHLEDATESAAEAPIRLRFVAGNLEFRNGGLPTIQQFSLLQGSIRLECRGQSAELPRGIHPDDGAVSLWLRSGDDDYARRYQPMTLSCGRAGTVTLNDGDVMEAAIPPLVGRQNWVTLEPGEREIVARCMLPDGRKLISNRLRFRVVPLPPAIASRVGALVSENSVAKYVMLNGSKAGCFEGVVERIEQLSRDNPELAISRQLMRLIDWAQIRTHSIMGDAEERRAAHTRAEELLTGAGDVLSHPLLAGIASPTKAANIMLDAYRTLSRYRGSDLEASGQGLIQRSREVMQRCGGSERARHALEHLMQCATPGSLGSA